MIRDRLVERVGETAAAVTTVWGLPGVGKTWVVRRALAERSHTWIDAHGLDAAALIAQTRGPTVWDGAEPEAARAAAMQVRGPVWVTCSARLRLAEERAVEVPRLVHAEVRVMLRAQFERRGLGAVPEGLDVACLGLPALVERASDLFELTGQVPTPEQWLDAPAGPEAADLTAVIDAHLEGVGPIAHSVLQRMCAFAGGFDLRSVASLGGVMPMQAVRTLRDCGVLELVHPGRFVVHPLIRAHLRRLDPSCAFEADGALFVALGRSATVAWTRLELDGTPPGMAGSVPDLLRTATARGQGWREALAVAVLHDPVGVPRSVVDEAVLADPRGALVLRTRARHLRSVGDNERALQDLDAATLEGDEEAWRERGALLHRIRRGEQARASYNRSLEGGAGARGQAIARANLAALDHDEMRFEAARSGYTAAIQALRLLGDERLAGLFASNLGALELELGRHGPATEALRRAVRQLERVGDARLLAIALGNLAWVEVECRRLQEASDLLERALAKGPDFRTRITLQIRLGAVRALSGDLRGSRVCFEEVTGLLLTSDDQLAYALADLYRGFLDVCSGDRTAGAARLAKAREPGEGRALVAVSDDARVGARWLDRMLLEAPGPRLVVGPGGAWVQLPDGSRADFSRFASVQRILLRLAHHRIAAPGSQLPIEALFNAGWPGETIQLASARNRVHVALNKLRAAGLKANLLRDAAGYLFDPAVPVFVTDDT